MKDLVERVKDECAKVWEAIQENEDRTFDVVDQGALDNLQISYDRRMAKSDATITEMYDKLVELDKAQLEIKVNLAKSEKELTTWTTASDATARALAEVQTMAARHQESL